MDTNRFKLSDRNSNVTGGQNVFIGNAFAFLGSNALKESGLSWLAKLLGKKNDGSPHIISLAGAEAVEILGVTLSPVSIERLFLQSIVSDKNLYRQEKDVINLLVVNPMAPRQSTVVLLRNSGTVFSRHRVELGANGEGSLKLKDLPIGDYDMVFEGQEEAACEFVVAEYRLVPLVASMVDSIADGDKLSVVLNVESFGIPLNGQLRLALMDRQKCVTFVNVDAVDGRAATTFTLTGEGPHTIAVQVMADPSKTATVPLRGSRESERSQTVFSPLGEEIVGSLLPQTGASKVRGLYLSEGALRVTPIALEKVDSDKAKFKINTSISSLKVVVLDPAFPRAKAGAIDVATEAHPGSCDQYRKGEELFKKGQFKRACELLQSRREQLTNPHPFYAYSIACCYAKAGQVDKAVASLREAFEDGWTDLSHMENDADLASLRGYQPYEDLRTGGVREIEFANLTAGQKIDVEAIAPASLILLGAFVDEKPWEGWTSIVTPSVVTTQITVPENCKPGDKLTIEFDAAQTGTSIYAIVKDARLISADTAELKLAAAMKKYIESAGKQLTVGTVSTSLKQIADEMWNTSRTKNLRGSLRMSQAQASSAFDTWGQAPTGMMMQLNRESGGVLDGNYGSSNGWGSPPAAPAPAAGGSLGETFGFSGGGGGAPATLAESIRARISEGHSVSEPVKWKAAADQYGSAEAVIDKLTPAKKPKTATVLCEDPEVLFAGFVQIKKGKGTLRVKLPDIFADYIVECFALNGMNWASHETRFRAVKEQFVQLTVPVFAKTDEPGIGTINVGSSTKAAVKVFCDGKPITIFDDERKPFNGEVSGPPASYSFVAIPGHYEATLVDNDGDIVARDQKRVNEPGKLRRIVRTLKLLEAGQSLNLKDDPSYVSIGLLPGLENSFNSLVQATADYAHCCCEQTSAKILSGCAMYMMANGDDDTRKKAEAVILAGIRREQSMWLRGRGFKSYPQVADHPDPHYGVRAARNLWNLALLQNDDSLSSDLRKGIEDGLEMASDTTKAYGFTWPPKDIHSCEEAYAAARFSTNGTVASAVSFVQKVASSDKALTENNPYLGTKVFARTEAAYAAATLLRNRGANDVKQALALANTVIAEFNEQARMYSTVDSVAAIALMSELDAAGITKGGGKVEVNGKAIDLEEALSATETMQSVKVVDGVVTLAVDRMVEDDWSAYASGVPLKISLEKSGQQTRRFTAGDTVDLVVTLEDGYKMGDLLWIALPDALSRIVGGGQVKLFSADFAGEKEVRISLAATAVTEDIDGNPQQQSLAVSVRNMFVEERAGCPGLLSISVTR